NRPAVDVYGTSAALRDSASEFGARELQEIAQNPEQRHIVRSLYCIVAPVDIERYHLSSQSLLRFQPFQPLRKSRSSLLTTSGCSSCGRWPQFLIGATERFSAISLQIAFMSNRRPTAPKSSPQRERTGHWIFRSASSRSWAMSSPLAR